MTPWCASGWSKASQTEAQKQAATEVAVPGTSEHQLGLAMDLVDASYQVLDEAQASTPRPAMADGALLGVWVHPALPRGEAGHHRHHL